MLIIRVFLTVTVLVILAPLRSAEENANQPKGLNPRIKEMADKGHPKAQWTVGRWYREGPSRDLAESVKWFRKAADQGDVRGQCELGTMLLYGQGVKEDKSEALNWYRKAADQEFAPAQTMIGKIYAEGIGVTKDEAEAVKWYRKAAEQGDADAQTRLGFAYGNGYGIIKDDAEAAKWWRKAAEQGEVSAQFNLGVALYSGRPVMNKMEAYKWMLIAGARGHKSARESIPKLEDLLTPAERAEGQRMARDFSPNVLE